MKAILLARVSSKDQEENNSIPAQLRRLREYAERRGFEDSEPHQLVESSTKATRKEFTEIICSIKNSSETVALVTDTIDRLQRGFRESVLLDELRNQGKVELHFIRENLIINAESNSADILRWDMGVMFAKSFVTQLSDNVKRGNEQKRLNGEWSGRAPFGYKNIDLPDGKKWVEPDEYALVVSNIFTWYATGSHTLQSIRKRVLDEYGIKLVTSQIESILKRKFYYGVMSVKGTDYRHVYSPIISKTLYDSAEEVRLGFGKRKYKYAGLPYFYRGLVSCSECGCAITAERQKGHVYYHCTQYKGKHKAPYIREEDLTAQLAKAFQAIQPTQEQFEQVMVSLKAAHGDKAKYRAKQESILRGELTKLEKRQERLFNAYLDELITKPEYEAKRNEIVSLKRDNENRLASLEDATTDFYDTLENLMRIAKNAPVTLERSKMQPRRDLIKLILSNLEIHERQLRWQYKKPFDLMASCAKNDTWQG